MEAYRSSGTGRESCFGRYMHVTIIVTFNGNNFCNYSVHFHKSFIKQADFLVNNWFQHFHKTCKIRVLNDHEKMHDQSSFQNPVRKRGSDHGLPKKESALVQFASFFLNAFLTLHQVHSTSISGGPTSHMMQHLSRFFQCVNKSRVTFTLVKP